MACDVQQQAGIGGRGLGAFLAGIRHTSSPRVACAVPPAAASERAMLRAGWTCSRALEMPKRCLDA